MISPPSIAIRLCAVDCATTPHRLSWVVDEVGYLSYSNRHADRLFELINRRHETRSTLITTNRSFSDWAEVFPNAACVVALIDRLVHHAEIIALKGESYRHKEAREHAEQRSRKRKATAGSTP
jgi:hypothetical protein